MNLNTQSLAAVSCPTARFCVAVGQTGTLATSTDPSGGAGAWKVIQVQTSVPPDCGKYASGEDCQADLTAVSCASTRFCVAVDEGDANQGDAISSTDPTGGATTWKTTQIDTHGGLWTVSCPAVSLCVTSDNFGTILASANPSGPASSWRAEFESNGGQTSVSCGSVNLCVQTAWPGTGVGLVAASTDPLGGPRAWTQSQVDPVGLTTVACSATQLCIAGGWEGEYVVGALPTRAQIKTALTSQIAPPPSERRTSTLRRNDGELLAVRSLGAGRLQIAWFATNRATGTVIATAAARFDRSSAMSANLKLTRAGRTMLKHHRRLNVIATATFTPINRAPVTARERFTLR